MATQLTGWRDEPNTVPGARDPAGPQPGIASQQLFGDRREIVIEHDGQCYRLSITRQNKLILTK